MECINQMSESQTGSSSEGNICDQLLSNIQFLYIIQCNTYKLSFYHSGNTTLPDLDQIVTMTKAAQDNKTQQPQDEDSDPVIVMNDEEFPPLPRWYVT